MRGCNKGATDAAGAHGGSSGGGGGGGSEESSRSVSKKKPSGGGKKGGSGGGGSGGKKVLPVCYLCGREFGTASLAIHVKECKKRYEREHGKPAPEAPDIPGLGGGGGTEDRVIMPSAKDWEAYNEQAWASAQAQLSPCELCGRTFQSDRLPVHMRGCSGPKKAAKDKAELTDAERKTADAVVGKMQDAVKEKASKTDRASGKASRALKGSGGKAKSSREGGGDSRLAVKPGSSAVAQRRWELAAAVEVDAALQAKAAAQAKAAEEDGALEEEEEEEGGAELCQPADDAGAEVEPIEAGEFGGASGDPPRAAVVAGEQEVLDVSHVVPPTSVLTSARRAAAVSSARGGGGDSKRGAAGVGGARGGATATGGGRPGAGGAKLTAKERMTQLKELLDSGLVSQDEFEAKRAEILANI